MSAGFLASRPETRNAGGRAGWWGLDTANPLVAGTYGAARAAVDVALTAADLVLGGERAAYGLCRPPGHHAARSMCGRLLLLQQRRDRRRGDRPRDRASASRSSTSTTTTATAPSRSSGAAATCSTSRSTPTRTGQYPFFLGYADETGEGRGQRREPQHPAAGGHGRRRLSRRAGPRRSRRSPATAGDVVVVSLGFDTYGHDPIGDFALTTAVYHECGRRAAALGRRLVILQEGGYHCPSLGANARAWLRGAEGRPYEATRVD